MSHTGHVPELDVLRAQVAELTRALAERDQPMHTESPHHEATLQDLREQSQLLHTIIEGTAAATGDQFFASLTTHLTRALQVQYAIIGEVVEDPPQHLRTLAVSVAGTLIDNFTYALEYAPCGTGLTEPFWCFEQAVQARFPHFPKLATLGVESHCGVSLRNKAGEVVGLMLVMDIKPLRNTERLKSLMEVFASRASAELQRYRAEVAQRQMEKSLRESEERFRAFFDHAPNLAFVKSTEGRYLYTNRRFEEAFGLSRNGALGKTDEELFAPDQSAQFRANDAKVFETEQPLECEEVAWLADAAHTSIAVKFPLRDASGRICAIGGITTDITDRKQAEEALLRQERHLVAAQALAHVGSWEWNIVTDEVIWSDEHYRIFGHAPGTLPLTSDSFFTALHPDDHDRVLAAINDALAAQKLLDIEYRILRPNGEVRFIHSRGEARRDATGHPLSMSGTMLDITEHTQVLEALRTSEERWHLVVQGSHDGVWDWDIRTGTVFFSTRWKAMRGYQDDDIGNSLDEWRSRIHPDDLDRVLQAVDGYLAKQRPDFCEEYRTQRHDGSYMWILDRGIALWDADGKPVRMAGSETDITERKRAEEALRETEARTRSIIETAMDAVISIGGDGHIIGWNAQAETIFGYAAHEVMGRKLSDTIIPPQHRQAHEAGLQRAFTMSGSQPLKRRIELHALHRQGHEFPVEFAITMTRAGGQPIFTAFIRDITEQKRAAEDLHRTAETLRAVVQSAPLAIATCNAEGRLTSWNPAAQRIFGWSEEEMLGQQMLAVTPGKEQEGEMLWRLTLQRHPIHGLELRRCRKDGTFVDIQFWGGTLLDADGNMTGALAVMADVTEQKRDAEVLAQRERQLRTVLEALPIGVWFTDAHGKVLLANPAARQLWTGAQRIGMGVGEHASNWWDTVGPVAEPHRWMLSEVLTQGKTASDDTLEITCEDGARKIVRNSSVPVRADDGSIQGAVLLNEDITERVRAEQERARSQAFLESVIENIPHMITVKDAKDLRFVMVNRAVERFFGRSRRELLGSSVFDVMPEVEGTQMFASDLEVLDRHEALDISDHLVHSPSFGVRVLRTKKLPIFARQEQPQHLLTISEDITERTQAETIERQRVAQLIRFQSAQLRFSKLAHRDLETDFRLISQATAEALAVERVSLWLFNKSRTSIICQDLYTLSDQQHQSGAVLDASCYPHYFAALESALIVAANEIGTDPRINEFAEDLEQLHITSRLDVPIRQGGNLIGVLCHEHVGSAREWSSEEEAFSISIADHAALCLAAAERRQMEAALRTSEERFAKAFRSSPHPVVIADVESGAIIEANDAAYHLFGYERTDVEGRTPQEIGLWPLSEDRSRFTEELRRRGSVKNLEVALRMKTGQLRQCLLSSELIELNGRRCMVTVGNDVTEQKRIEEALRRSEARLTEAQRIAHLGSWELDLIEKKLTWSDEVYRIFERDPHTFRATYDTFIQLVHPQDREGVDMAYQNSVAHKKPYSLVHRLLLPNGRIKFVHGQCETAYDPQGRPIRSLGTVQDITEQKHAEEVLKQREQDLRHAMEERERISQDLHDGILQSLYAVGLGLEACKPLINAHRHQEALDTTEQAIGQLNRVMAEVRNFIAGLESEALQEGTFETALRTVINTVTQLHPIDCRIHIEHEALAYIPLDRALQLLNIIREALSNVVRHAQATHVSVSVRRLRRTIRIRVHDNGVGFDPKTAAGTGHGLLNMAARAKKLRMEFELHSAIGEGTTIMLDLPKEEVYVHG